MDDQPQYFQSEFADATTVHPLALAALIVAGALTLVLPRRWALLPLIVLSCFVPQAQRIVMLGLDLTFVRIMLLVGWFRVLLWQEFREYRLKLLDKVVLAWTGLELVMAIGNKPALTVYYCGELLTRAGLYFMCRMLVHSFADVWRLTTAFMIISIPVAMAFLYEHMTARNVFSVFGGVPAITALRQERLRCQGAFAHPILAGCFWAALMPLMAAVWYRKGARLLTLAGLASSAVIVVMCASSTPVFAVLLGALGMSLIVVRWWMRWITWAIVLVLCGLHLIMIAPVWHLLARVSAVGGSTGWHRYSLIDKFVNNWREWLLHGSSQGTAHWGYGLFDVTNYYVIQGMRGGLLLLLVFLVVLYVGFRSTGKTWRAARKDRLKLMTAWALGVCLAQHCANLIAVTYFGQINLVWCLQLAMIASLTPALAVTKPRWKTARARAQRAGEQPIDETEPALAPG
jgi:hypothetical protein